MSSMYPSNSNWPRDASTTSRMKAENKAWNFLNFPVPSLRGYPAVSSANCSTMASPATWMSCSMSTVTTAACGTDSQRRQCGRHWWFGTDHAPAAKDGIGPTKGSHHAGRQTKTSSGPTLAATTADNRREEVGNRLGTLHLVLLQPRFHRVAHLLASRKNGLEQRLGRLASTCRRGFLASRRRPFRRRLLPLGLLLGRRRLRSHLCLVGRGCGLTTCSAARGAPAAGRLRLLAAV